MFKKLVFSGYKQNDLPQEQWNRINAVCEQVCLTSLDNLGEEISDAEGLFVKLGATVDQSLMDSAPNLRVIGMLGTGYGRIDTTYARKKDISVFNVADYATDAVAEFVFGLLLNHLRELPRSLKNVESGDYSEADFTGTQLRGKTLGILGLGDIGSRVAQIAANGFGMTVLYWSQNRKKEQETKDITYADAEVVLSESDFVSLHMALTPETEGFLNTDKIALLPNGAVLVNTAPMELIDLPALEKRLKSGDVSLLLDHPDEMKSADVARVNQYTACTVYPPIGYTTNEASAKKLVVFTDNIFAAAKGTHLPNLVN